MIRQRVYWCPTIYVGVRPGVTRPPLREQMSELKRKAFGEAVRRGMGDLIAFGTDAGRLRVVAEPGAGVRVIRSLRHDARAVHPHRRPRTPPDCSAATRRSEPIVAGKLAVLVAVEGDPLADPPR
jgi:hypothetical protein